MYNARQGKINPGEWANFVMVTGIGNKIRKKQYDAPDQHMDHKTKIPVFDDSHHLVCIASCNEKKYN